MFELITVEFILTLTIVFFASYIFVKNENWSYFGKFSPSYSIKLVQILKTFFLLLDSIYYCLITLLTIGFGDLVPMQRNNALSSDFTYVSFTILFILTGLTTLASTMNLLVLRIATINAEEQVQIKLQEAEAQAQRCYLDGDIINRRKLFKADDEKPDKTVDDNLSVCSCACLDNKQIFVCNMCCFKVNNNNNKSSKNIKTKNQQQQQPKFFSFLSVKRLGKAKHINKNRKASLTSSNHKSNDIQNKLNNNNNIKLIVNNYEKDLTQIKLNANDNSFFGIKSYQC